MDQPESLHDGLFDAWLPIGNYAGTIARLLSAVMSGRRLLDTAAVIKASRAIASKHLALRQRQWTVYSKTSSLAKAVQSQTQSVTFAWKAAAALAGKYYGQDPRYSTQTRGSETPTTKASRSSPTSEAKNGAPENSALHQDHFSEGSKGNPNDPAPNEALGVKQEEAPVDPLPDGTILPAGSNIDGSNSGPSATSSSPETTPTKDDTAASSPASSTASADHARKLQRDSEEHIPSIAAESPPTASSNPQAGASIAGESNELGLDQNQEVFYTPSSESKRVYSALPRVKIPKSTEDAQESDPDTQINQDVFYSSRHQDQQQVLPKAQGSPEQDQPSEGIYSEIFQSPRVARLLSGKPQPAKPSKGLGMKAAQDTPVEGTKISQAKDQETLVARPASLEHPKSLNTASSQRLKALRTESGDDVRQLASDLAGDFKATSPAPEVQPAVCSAWAAY